MTKSLKLHTDIILSSRHGNKPMLMDIRYQADHHKKAVILFVHGFKGFKDWGHFNLVADKMAEAGFVFVKFNLSHNGTSPEYPSDFVDLEAFSENTFTIELDDLETTIDYLFSEDCIIPSSEIDLTQLFLMGHSRGGGLALLKAHEDDRIKAVATWSAVSDFNRWSEDIKLKWKEDGVIYIPNARTKQEMPMKYRIVEDLEKNQDRLSVLRAVSNLKKPLLIIHGTADETVSIQDAENIYSHADNGKLLKLEGANHVFGASHPYQERQLPSHALEAVEKTISFFESLH